jgi:hypothetical protein
MKEGAGEGAIAPLVCLPDLEQRDGHDAFGAPTVEAQHTHALLPGLPRRPLVVAW